MDLNVTLLNFLRYEDKETKKPKIRIGYINNDKAYIENTDKFKGYAELSVYIDDKNCWDFFKTEMTGDTAIFTFAKRPNPRNPLKDVTVLQSIKTNKHGDISLL